MRTLAVVLMILFLAVGCEAQLVKPSTASSSTDQTARDTANTGIALARTKLDTSKAFKWTFGATSGDSLRFIAGTGVTLTKTSNTLTITNSGVTAAERTVPAYVNDTTKFLRSDSSWITPTAAGLGDITAVTVTSPLSGGGVTGALSISADTSTTGIGLATLYQNSLKADKTTQVIAGTGLTGGGTFAADRTLKVDSTAFVATDYDVSLKAPLTWTLTAGTGLSGGGSLAANRTVSADSTSWIATDYNVSLKWTLGTLGLANGGTGGTTKAGAITNLLPDQSGKSGLYLKSSGTAGSETWEASSAIDTVARDSIDAVKNRALEDAGSRGKILWNRGDTNYVGLTTAGTVSFDSSTGVLTGSNTGSDTLGLFSVKRWGAVGDSTTNDCTEIKAAVAAATAARGTLYFPKGVYRTDTTITIGCAIKSDPRAKIVTKDTTNPAIVWTSPDLGLQYTGMVVEFPSIQQITHSAGYWPGDSLNCVGVEITNAKEVTFKLGHITGFTTGVKVGGAGIVGWCDFYGGHVVDNRINIMLRPDDNASYWVNENTFTGTLCAHSTGDDGALNQTHVQIDSSYNAPDHNSFLYVSVEGDKDYYSVELNGAYNRFVDCRWETQDGDPRVWIGNEGARASTFSGMYWETVQVTRRADGYVKGKFESHEGGLNIRSPGNYPAYSGADMADNDAAVYTVMDYSDTLNSNRKLRYQFGAGATYIQGKTKTDSTIAPKWRLNNQNGTLWLNGNATPAAPATGILLYMVSGGANADTLRAIDHLGNVKTLMP